MIKCVIFDLDGVIVSTDIYHYKAWKMIAAKEHIYFDKTINNQLRGVSRMESLDIILRQANKKYTKKEKIKLAEIKNSIYQNYLKNLTENNILPGINNVIRQLKERNIKIAIGSSSKNTKVILKYLKLDTTFDAVSDGTNITKSKPDPEVFQKAADMLNISYNECAVIEDAYSGIMAAKACNMIAFAVGDAKSSSFKDYNFEDLIDIIDKYNNIY